MRRTKRIDHTVVLLRDSRQSARPLAAVTERADAFQLVWTVEGSRKEVPCMCMSVGQRSSSRNGSTHKRCTPARVRGREGI